MSTPATQGCTGPKRHSQVKTTLPDKVLVMSLVLSVAAAWSWVLGARFCWGFLFFLYTLLGLCHLKKLFSARKTLNPPPSKQGTHVLLLFLFFSIRGGDLGQSKLQGSMFFACLWHTVSTKANSSRLSGSPLVSITGLGNAMVNHCLFFPETLHGLETCIKSSAKLFSIKPPLPTFTYIIPQGFFGIAVIDALAHTEETL